MATLFFNAKLWQWDSSDLASSVSSGRCVNALDWVAVQNGRIVDIGNGKPLPDLKDFENIQDCRGQMLLPGLMDSHIHVAMTGESKYFLDLSSCRSINELQISLQKHIELHPDLTWIQGVNWDQSRLGSYPTRYDLDKVAQNKLVFLWRACWHIGVGSTAALIRSGIDVSCTSRIVDGGVIDVDDTGVTGVLRERAVELVVSAIGKKTDTELKQLILDGLQECLSQGLTGVQTNDSNSFHIYKSLCDENQLNMRVFLTPDHDELSNIDSPVSVILPHRALNDSSIAYDDQRSYFSYDRVKIFSDGSLGAETAAIRLSSQFTDTESTDLEFKGIFVHSVDELVSKITLAKLKGYRLEIHAIGDAAADQVITALEKTGNTREDRAILTHCQVLGEDLITRMKEGGIIANVQPSFVPTDMEWVSARISLKQQRFSYAWKTLMNMGVHVAGGSDSPIESSSPFVGMYDAIYRGGRGENKNKVFHPSERLTFSEALWIYTVGAAYAARCEHALGAISIGFCADFVLVDHRIVDDCTLLATTKPELVVVGGRIVHRGDNVTALSDSVSRDIDRRLQGPFIPGKGGLRRSQTPMLCACALLGRHCQLQTR